ncbi:FG-GAP repeat domain-containing protein [Microbulbifer agarilyticus]
MQFITRAKGAARLRAVFLTSLSLGLAACGGGSSNSGNNNLPEGPTNNPPTISLLQISPEDAFTDTELRALIEVSDSDGDTLSFDVSWRVNGTLVEGQTSEYLSSTYFSSGDKVTFSLTASDGQDSTTADAEIVISNTPPWITQIGVAPEEPNTTTDISVSVIGNDIDEQTLTTSFQWYVNDQAISNSDASTLASTHFSKDDIVKVDITVSDGEDEVYGARTVTIGDSPAEFDFSGVPETVTYGVPVTFSISVFDPDDEKTALTLSTQPNGMTIDEDGTINWTPTGPMFDSHLDVSWAVTATQGEETVSSGTTITVIDEDREYPLSRSGLNTIANPYKEGVAIGNFSSQDNHEILLTDQQHQLSTLAHDGQGYSQNWMYPFALATDRGGISSVAAADIDDDGIDEIIVGLRRGHSSYEEETELVVIDGISRKLIEFTAVDGESVNAIRFVDVDNDGEKELVLNIETSSYWEQRIVVLNAETLSAEWTSPSLTLGRDIAIGDTDGDGTAEIVTPSGYVYGFNGNTYSNEWLYGDGFGSAVSAGDLDNDGIADIIGTQEVDYESYLTVFDASSKSVKAQLSVDTSSFTVKDVDEDGSSEILLFGDFGSTVTLYSFDPAGTPKFSVDWQANEGSRHDTIGLIGDVDSDSQLEYIWISSYETPLIIAGTNPDITVEWAHSGPTDIESPFSGGQLVDFPGESSQLIYFTEIMQRSPSYSSDFRAVKLNPTSGKVTYSSPISNQSYGNFSGTVIDLANDGSPEIIYAQNETPSLFDLVTESIAWTAPKMPDDVHTSTSGDVNGDDEEDLIVTTTAGNTYAYDAKNQLLLWSIEDINALNIAVAELGTGKANQVLLTDSNTIYKYTPGNGEAILDTSYSLLDIPLEWLTHNATDYSISSLYIQAITVGDMNGDNENEIVITTDSYSDFSVILILDSNLVPQRVFEIDGRLRDVRIQPYGDTRRNLLVNYSADGSYYGGHEFIVIDSNSGGIISRSPEFYTPITKGSLHYVDTDKDGIPEISYGNSKSMNVTR